MYSGWGLIKSPSPELETEGVKLLQGSFASFQAHVRRPADDLFQKSILLLLTIVANVHTISLLATTSFATTPMPANSTISYYQLSREICKRKA